MLAFFIKLMHSGRRSRSRRGVFSVQNGYEGTNHWQRRIDARIQIQIAPIIFGFISEFAPPKMHVFPVCIRHFVTFIAFGYGVPLIVQDGLDLLRHSHMHRLHFSEARRTRRSRESRIYLYIYIYIYSHTRAHTRTYTNEAKNTILLTVCARAAPSNGAQENAAAFREFPLERDKRNHRYEQTLPRQTGARGVLQPQTNRGGLCRETAV